jgi:predicted dehydrogenase
MTFKALVIGLGQIGMGYDLNLDPEAYVLTHARAFQQHPEFQLIGGVDPDQARRGLFEAYYGVPAYADIKSAMAAQQPEVVAIASPTAMHAQAVNIVLQAGRPVAILCEKPLSFDTSEARSIVSACAEHECGLYVNYMRRSDQGVIEIKRRLSDGRIRRPIKSVVWYSKGLYNSGSHFFNLLQYWLGSVKDFRILEPGRLWDGLDPEPDLRVAFEDGVSYFLSAREECFSHYTVELIAPNGRLRYEQGGGQILWQGTAGDSTCAGYTILTTEEECVGTDFSRSQWHVVSQLAESLYGRYAEICNGTEALETIEVLAMIRSEL